MRISDWSSDVCSSDLGTQQRDAKERNENESPDQNRLVVRDRVQREAAEQRTGEMGCGFVHGLDPALFVMRARAWCRGLLFAAQLALAGVVRASPRSAEHTSELQSLTRNSYAVFCLNKKQKQCTTARSPLSSTQHD